jgi:hypothetical protein
LTFHREAIEDLTGGVTSEIMSNNILDKDRFWREELMQVNKEFLFGCGTGLFSNWLDPKYRGPPKDRKGISENHSYSIMEAKEVDGQRLLRLRYACPMIYYRTTSSPSSGIRGVRKNGLVPGVTDQSNGHRNGWRNWDINSAMMAYGSLNLSLPSPY